MHRKDAEHAVGTRRISAVLFALGLGLVAGCSSNKPIASPIAKNAPDWVNRSGGAFKDNGQGVFYGVASSQGIRLRDLAITTAETRSCAKIASIMDTYVSRLTKSYMASTMAGDPSKTSDEQHVSDTLKTFTKFTLHGAQVTEHWTDQADGTIFALCKLDMNTFKNSLNESKELDAKVRDYVKANAEKAFDELAAEEAKH